MQQVHKNLFVGGELDCTAAHPGWYVVHACKSPCHQRAVGYHRSLKSDHPNYIVLQRENELFLNLIDPPAPLFQMESFLIFLRLTYERWQKGQDILIHCNQGLSRAPTLALLLMSKRLGALPTGSYQAASSVFRQAYPTYKPGQGIQIFLRANWDLII